MLIIICCVIGVGIALAFLLIYATERLFCFKLNEQSHEFDEEGYEHYCTLIDKARNRHISETTR